MKMKAVINKEKRKPLIPTLLFSALLAVSATSVMASGDHGHSHDSGGHEASDSKHNDHNDGHGKGHDDAHDDGHSHGDSKMSGGMKGMFLKKKEIDGYTVSFHVMKAKDGMGHDGTHNFMIKVEKGGTALNNVVINSKIVHPNNQSESKMLMKMGDWYMTGYDLGHKGKHQLMILFKTSDGKKHKGGVYYPG